MSYSRLGDDSPDEVFPNIDCMVTELDEATRKQLPLDVLDIIGDYWLDLELDNISMPAGFEAVKSAHNFRIRCVAWLCHLSFLFVFVVSIGLWVTDHGESLFFGFAFVYIFVRSAIIMRSIWLRDYVGLLYSNYSRRVQKILRIILFVLLVSYLLIEFRDTFIRQCWMEHWGLFFVSMEIHVLSQFLFGKTFYIYNPLEQRRILFFCKTSTATENRFSTLPPRVFVFAWM